MQTWEYGSILASSFVLRSLYIISSRRRSAISSRIRHCLPSWVKFILLFINRSNMEQSKFFFFNLWQFIPGLSCSWSPSITKCCMLGGRTDTNWPSIISAASSTITAQGFSWSIKFVVKFWNNKINEEMRNANDTYPTSVAELPLQKRSYQWHHILSISQYHEHQRNPDTVLRPRTKQNKKLIKLSPNITQIFFFSCDCHIISRLEFLEVDI
jgi:hypothetical protein